MKHIIQHASGHGQGRRVAEPGQKAQHTQPGKAVDEAATQREQGPQRAEDSVGRVAADRLGEGPAENGAEGQGKDVQRQRGEGRRHADAEFFLELCCCGGDY